MKKNILIGVTGGIAVFKICSLVSKLKKSGYEVDIIMTENATKFVTPLTFEVLSGNRVHVDMFDKVVHRDVEHIELAKKADLLFIAPATYNIVGKVASGIADDMLSTVISATKAPVYFALAMNTNMYENPILWENIEKLKKCNYKFVESSVGMLACNTSGKGRLKEADELFEVIDNYFSREQILSGKKILITAGRTEEDIDPMRFMTNRSTGKMGWSIAKASRELGGEVDLILGPSSLEKLDGVKTFDVRTAMQMYDMVMENHEEYDIIIMSAAVADYRVKNLSKEKIKKSDGDFSIEFVRNPDILKELGSLNKKSLLVGFAAESENIVENGKGKLISKKVDYIVANNLKNAGSDENEIVIIGKNGFSLELKGSKEDLAYRILETVVK